MKTKRFFISRNALLPLAMAVFVLGAPQAVYAASQTWTNTAGGTWDTNTANWSGGVVWTNNNDAVFASANGSSATVTASGGVVVNDIFVTNTGYTIAGNLSLGDDKASTISNSSAVTISAALADSTNGASSITKLGSGALTLSGNSTYSGGTTLSLGQININSATALGTGVLTLGTANVVIDNTSGGAISVSNGMNWNANFTFAGTKNLAFLGAVNVGNAMTLTATAGELTLGGTISGTNWSKGGAGTLTLTGSNNYTGTTGVSGGTVLVKSGNAINGATNLSVSGGASLIFSNDTTPITNSLFISAITSGQLVVGTNATINATKGLQFSAGNNSTATVLLTNGGVFNLGGSDLKVNTGGSNATSRIVNAGGTLNWQTNFIPSLGRSGGTNVLNAYIQTAGTANGYSVGIGGTNWDLGNLANNNANLNYTNLISISGGAFNGSFYKISMARNFGTNIAINGLYNTFSVTGGTADVGWFEFGTASTNYNNLTQSNIVNTVYMGGGTLSAQKFVNNFSNAFTGYSNQIVFDGGTLKASANSGANFLPNMSNTLVALSNTGGTIDLAGYTNTIAANISGAGLLVVTNSAGSGELTLTASNAYSGGTRIDAGVVNSTSTGALGIGALTLNAAAGKSAEYVLGNAWINLTNAVVVSGAGTNRITGTWPITGQVNGMAGGVTLSNADFIYTQTGNGGLRMTNNGITGTGNVTFENNTTTNSNAGIDLRAAVNNTGTLTFSGTGDSTVEPSLVSRVNGAGGSIGANVTKVVQDSKVNLDLAGTMDAGSTAGIDIKQSKVILNNASALRVGNTVAVASGATLDVEQNNTIAGLNNYSGAGGTVLNNAASDKTLTVGGSSSYSFGGALTDGTNGGKLLLTKSGSGTQTLTGNSTYTGATAVSAGSLIINGDNSSAIGAVTVASGATLGGSGKIGGATTIQTGGTLAPGNSPGLLTFTNNLTLEGAVVMELNGLGRGTTYDAIDVGGLLTCGGSLSLNFGSTFANGDSFNLFDFGSTNGASFASIGLTGSYGTGSLVNSSGTWSGTVGGQGFTFLESDGTLNLVPEPSTYALLGLSGAAALVARFRRRARK